MASLPPGGRERDLQLRGKRTERREAEDGGYRRSSEACPRTAGMKVKLGDRERTIDLLKKSIAKEKESPCVLPI